MAGLYALFGVGTLLFAYLDADRLTPFFLLVLPPVLGGTVSLRGAIVREYFGRRSFGKMFGILIGLAAIGGVIGPSLAGWTYDRLGTYRPVWVCFAGIMVVGVLLILQLKVPDDRITRVKERA
jgi:MFS family permease